MATLPSKKEVLLGLLEKTSVLVHLDARRDEVIVPKHLKSNAQLILQLGLNLAVPIKDLDVSDVGVSCTLSFSRKEFYCVLPYPAIFAMVSEDGGRAMVWPEDVPAEVARAAEAEARKLGLVKSSDTPSGEVEAVPQEDRNESRFGTPSPIQQSVHSAPKKSREEKSPAPSPARAQKSKSPLIGGPRAPRAVSASSDAKETPPRKTPNEKNEPARPKRELPPYLRVIK